MNTFINDVHREVYKMKLKFYDGLVIVFYRTYSIEMMIAKRIGMM